MLETMICFLMAFGLAVMLLPEAIKASGAISARRTISREVRRFTVRTRPRTRGPMIRKIERLTESSGTDSIFKSAEMFISFSALLSAAAFLSAYRTLGMMAAGVMAFGALMLPYGWSWLRLSAKRSCASREGDILIQELINNYRITSRNMKEAIDMTALKLDEKSEGRRAIMELAKALNNSASEIETDQALDRFRYSFGAAWGNILASNISLALKTGISVEESMDDLSKSMAKSKSVAEHGKRQNYESKMMLRYLIPACYALSFAAAILFFGFTPLKFLRFQFATKSGMTWFAASLACWVMATATEKYISNEKMDI